HDVCAWIKKFFRELRQPIFANRETKLIQFVDSLHGEVLVGALLSLIDRLPASHVGTLGYLMRCLQKIAESSHLHQMTVENLATIFAPSLFRGIQEKETKMSKKRNGSQEDLLRTLKRTNDLQALVLKVLIENAEKIGASKDFLKATKSAAGRNLMTAAKPPSGYTSGAYSKINSCLIRTSRSTTNLISEPSPSTRSPNNQRSNSVVRTAFRSFKKSLTNLTSEAFSSSYESAASKMASKNQETSVNSVDEIQGTGVVNRRIQQFKNLSLVNQPSPSGKESSFTKPLIKSSNKNCPSPQPKSINSSSSDNSSKSSKFGSHRAKSVTSMYSTGSSTPNYARPSVSASSQMSLFPPPPPPPPSTKKIEGAIKFTR
uniref:Rho-GAP domain-containing protein n=1 Tax=Panagrolaimus sp. PS1159 TaxID=55785 RepID=A0AC35FIC8_9BILA